MRHFGSGTVPPDENLDRLLRTSLREDFAEYAPDPTSALGELRHRSHGMERKPRRILPFLPGLPKTVIAVVCVVIVTAALLVVPRVFHIRAGDTKPVTPSPVVRHDDFEVLSVRPEMHPYFGVRFGPAFTLYGPNGVHVTGELSYNIATTLPARSLCNGSIARAPVRLTVTMILMGDVSMVSKKTFSAMATTSAAAFAYEGDIQAPDDREVTSYWEKTHVLPRKAAGAIWQSAAETALLRPQDTRIPVDIDLTFIGQKGLRTVGHLSAAEGFDIVTNTKMWGGC